MTGTAPSVAIDRICFGTATVRPAISVIVRLAAGGCACRQLAPERRRAASTISALVFGGLFANGGPESHRDGARCADEVGAAGRVFKRADHRNITPIEQVLSTDR